MISIIDYGMGNVGSILNMYRFLDIPAELISTPEEVEGAQKLILPGVGSFDEGMRTLKDNGLLDALNARVLEQSTPVLGICLGAQLLTERSEEGVLPGLSWIDGETKRFTFGNERRNIPHMGWNVVRVSRENPLFHGMEGELRFYFVHSYHLVCDPQEVIGVTNYGFDFASAVQKDNIFGVQFHPEKSHRFGMRLLKNFAELV